MLGHKPEEQFYIKKMEKSSLASLKHQKLEKKQYTSINRPEQDTVMRRLRHKSSPWGPPMDVEPREFMKGGDYTHCSSYTVKHDPGVWERYYQQIQESKGFEIDDFPGLCMAAGIVPLKNLDESSEFYFLLSQMATKALNEFNSDKEKSYIVHKIVRVNSEVSGGVIYYTTFEALNPEAAYAIQIFRAKIFDRGPRGTDVLSCYPEEFYQQIRHKEVFELNHFTGHYLAAETVPIENLDKNSKLYISLCQMATKGLNHFNSWKGTNYKFRKIVSVISTAACGVNLYTTFESTDPKASRAIQSFVAVIYCGPLGTDVLSCGLKNPSHGGQSSDDDASRPWVHLKENEGWSIGVHGKLEEYSTGTKSKALESREFMKGGGYTHCSSYMVKDDPGVWKSHYQQIHRSMAGTCWSSSWGRK